MTIVTSEDRAAPAFAASVMERLLPSPRDRLLVLRQLLNSVDIALSVSTDVWALTLFQAGFRLNVGQVEVMTFNAISGSSPSPNDPAAVSQNANLLEIRLLLHGEIADDAQRSIDEGKDTHQLLASSYKSVPAPQFSYVCSTGSNSGSLPNDNYLQIERALALLAPQHAAFVWHAAHTVRGKVRQTSSFRRSHSQGLYTYASSFVRDNWQPSIEQHNDAHSLGRSGWAFQEEPPSGEPLVEGASITAKVSAFERNPLARQECVAHHGTVMEHFIAYHSAQKMGDDYDSPGALTFLSKKLDLLKKAVGNTVWVIQGTPDGTKTAYTLCGVYVADGIAPESPSSSVYVIRGSHGYDCVPPVPLNQLSWFPSLLKSQSNFSLGFNRLSDESVILALSALQTENNAAQSGPSLPDVDFAASVSEGGLRLVSHLRRERKRAVVEAKKAAVLSSTGRLPCEVCGFDFSVTYDSVGEGFCEVHHLSPLSASDESVTTTLADLAVLCSNCHRIIHRSDPMLSVAELSALLRNRRP